jgi:flagellar hook-basal body complex protein FliE
MAIGGVGGVGGINLSQLAQAYRQQMTGAAAATSGSDAATRAAASGGVDAGTAARGADFASAVGNGLQKVEALDRSAAGKAVQAATGDLKDIHDYVIAATQAQTATELTTTVRNKALDAFNEIMRMPL